MAPGGQKGVLHDVRRAVSRNPAPHIRDHMRVIPAKDVSELLARVRRGLVLFAHQLCLRRLSGECYRGCGMLARIPSLPLDQQESTLPCADDST